jgi:hypothetical protein
MKNSENTVVQKIHPSFSLCSNLLNSASNLCLIIMLSFMYTPEAIALGRLFMTPQQRVELEQNKIVIHPTNSELENSQTLHVNGFIKPKHSASTIWVNGQVRSNRAKKDYYVRQWISPSHQISIDLHGSRASLRPGQTLDLKNRVVKEAFALTLQTEPALQSIAKGAEKNDQLDKKNTPTTLSVLQKAKEISNAMESANNP